MKNNLKERIDNGVKFVKDHKKEILIGSGTVLAAVVTGKKILELRAEVREVRALNIGIEAICKQQNLNFEDVTNDELSNIIIDIFNEEEKTNERTNMVIKNIVDRFLEK